MRGGKERGRERGRSAKQIAEGKGENEAECADCDAFRSGAALTVLLLPISTFEIRSLIHLLLPSLFCTPSSFVMSEKNRWKKDRKRIVSECKSAGFLLRARHGRQEVTISVSLLVLCKKKKKNTR